MSAKLYTPIGEWFIFSETDSIKPNKMGTQTKAAEIWYGIVILTEVLADMINK